MKYPIGLCAVLPVCLLATSKTHAGPEVAVSGVLQPGWNLVSVPAEGVGLPFLWREAGAVVWRVFHLEDAQSRVLEEFPIDREVLDAGGYWVHVEGSTASELFQILDDSQAPASAFSAYERRQAGASAPEPPGGFVAVVQSRTATLVWRAPQLFADGNEIPEGMVVSYQVYREGEPIGSMGNKLRFDDELREGRATYAYHVTAWVRDLSGNPVESEPSETIFVETPSARRVTEPGHFEPANPLPSVRGSAARVQVALSEFESAFVAHVAHIVRDNGAKGDGVRYFRSDKAGKPGSFEEAQDLASVEQPVTISDLSVAARDGRVSVVWIERDQNPQEERGLRASTHIVLVESDDGGRTFGTRNTVRTSDAWVRGLDSGYDVRGQHHVVWGEKNKIYYLMGSSGEPSNVFDVVRKETPSENVKYLIRDEPDDDGNCDCVGCWCEESYRTGETRNPENEEHSLGAQVSRIEESYVYEPSLHLGSDTISIVARRTRMWDNLPVVNDRWTQMMEAPIYDDKVVQRLQPIRLVVGWKSVWKDFFRPGDEEQMEAVGFQHQYLYRGQWHEQDQIVLAQRPLVADAWPVFQENGDAGRESVGHQDATESALQHGWRQLVVARVGQDENNDRPSHPRLVDAPWGLTMVYEDGPSDNPNESGFNPIWLQSSVDNGRSWSEPRRVATGYLPQPAVSASGDVTVLAYVPLDSGQGTVSVVQSFDGQDDSGTSYSVNADVAKPVHWKSHGSDADVLIGGASLVTLKDLFFAAWIEQGADGDNAQRVVTSRASRAQDAVRYAVAPRENQTAGHRTPVEVGLENVYHMRVPGTEGPGVHLARLAGVSAPLLDVSLHEGPAVLSGDLTALIVFGDGLISSEVVDGRETIGPLTIALEDHVDGAREPVGARGNLDKAKTERDRLWRNGDLSEDGLSAGYQVEYVAVDEKNETLRGASDWLAAHFDSGKAEDSKSLAAHERVWAYSQGIALAQLSREKTVDSDAKAQALARYLCAKAKVVRAGRKDNGSYIQGWPFSWNTLDDTWEDSRLVTGATAWVIHGLGVFLMSPAFRKASLEAQRAIKLCYHRALDGLKRHRLSGETSDGLRVTLMTAGWTTQGLAHADEPWRLRGNDDDRMGQKGESWHYYDVLDAIGYEAFNPDFIPTIRRSSHEPGAATEDETGESPPRPDHLEALILTPELFSILKKQVLAKNVVTEHNLDVLSVLNHAIDYASALDIGKMGSIEASELVAWRDELRNGIFHVLWDDGDQYWRSDLTRALEASPSQSEKRKDILAALEAGQWGRVATGGVTVADAGGTDAASVEKAVHIQAGLLDGFDFIPSRQHTAIDNCSWLSLAVDYEDLTDPAHVEQLARCLTFTTLAFAKDIEFRGKTYYGAHYFFDGFEDKYISRTDRQEQSFHLEATTGLILGLLKFADAYPQHPKTPFLVREAYRLWSGVQGFVSDHGFPYSSQRIRDLSTLLTSSTALIWFIDVHAYFEARNKNPDRSLRNYATGVEPEDAVRFVSERYDHFRALARSGLGLIPSTEPGPTPATRIEDQAMALIVAANHHDWDTAEVLAGALLRTRRPDGDSGESASEASHLEFPAVVSTSDGEPLYPYRSTNAQMTAYLALASYARSLQIHSQRVEGGPPGPRDPILEGQALHDAVVLGLASMVSRCFDPSSPETRGLFIAQDAEVPPEGRRYARIESNILAYFAFLHAWTLSLEPKITDLGISEDWLSRFETRIAGLCREKTLTVFEDGAVQRFKDAGDSSRGALGLCALFASASGQLDAGVLDGLASHIHPVKASLLERRFEPEVEQQRAVSLLLTSADASHASHLAWLDFVALHGPNQPNHWALVAGEALALRALANIDPRHGELALESFGALRALSGRETSHLIAPLLLHAPGTLFQPTRGPLKPSAGPLFSIPGFREGVHAIEPVAVEHALDGLTAEAMRTLLYSDFSVPVFDELLHRVALFAYLRRNLRDYERSPHEWVRAFWRERLSWIRRADQLLQNPCDEALWSKNGLDKTIGLNCGSAGALYTSLRWERVGGSPHVDLERIVADPERHDLGRLLDILLRSVHHRPDFRIEVPLQSASGTLGIKKRLQEAYGQSYLARAEAALQESSASVRDWLLHQLRFVDPLDALNVGSTDYWSMGSVGLRTALELNRQGRISLQSFPGFGALELPPKAKAGQNIRSLRRRLNLVWNGELSKAARSSGLLPVVLHRAMQTGELAEDVAKALSRAEEGLAEAAKPKVAALVETDHESPDADGWILPAFASLDDTKGGVWRACPAQELGYDAKLWVGDVDGERQSVVYVYDLPKGVNPGLATSFGAALGPDAGPLAVLKATDLDEFPYSEPGCVGVDWNTATSTAAERCVGATGVSQKECEALVSFYQATGGQNWRRNDQWLESTTPCEWYGVECKEGKIVELNVSYNNLDGYLPRDLVNLRFLEDVNLAGNSALGGPLPTWVGKFAELQYLNLGFCDFEGTIPSTVGQLSNLEDLRLSRNAFLGSIPSELGQLTNLSWLLLYGNRLQGEIPDSLGNLAALYYLDLSENELEGEIPDSFGRLSKVDSLRLNHNRLNGEIPASMGDLSVRWLDLSANGLDGDIPVALADVQRLDHLDLRYNVNLGPMPSALLHLKPGTGREGEPVRGAPSRRKLLSIGEIVNFTSRRRVSVDTRGKALELEVGLYDLAKDQPHDVVLEFDVQGEDYANIEHPEAWDEIMADGLYRLWANLVDPGVNCDRACRGQHYWRDEWEHSATERCEGVRIIDSQNDNLLGVFRHYSDSKSHSWMAEDYELSRTSTVGAEGWEVRSSDGLGTILRCQASTRLAAIDPTRCAPFERVPKKEHLLPPIGGLPSDNERLELECMRSLPDFAFANEPVTLDLDGGEVVFPDLEVELATNDAELEILLYVIHKGTQKVYLSSRHAVSGPRATLNPVFDELPEFGSYQVIGQLVEPGGSCAPPTAIENSSSNERCLVAYDFDSLALNVVASKTFGFGDPLRICPEQDDDLRENEGGSSGAYCTVKSTSPRPVRLQVAYDPSILRTGSLENDRMEFPPAGDESISKTISFRINTDSAPFGSYTTPVVFS